LQGVISAGMQPEKTVAGMACSSEPAIRNHERRTRPESAARRLRSHCLYPACRHLIVSVSGPIGMRAEPIEEHPLISMSRARC
jgi:hypothetical protein